MATMAVALDRNVFLAYYSKAKSRSKVDYNATSLRRRNIKRKWSRPFTEGESRWSSSADRNIIRSPMPGFCNREDVKVAIENSLPNEGKLIRERSCILDGRTEAR